MKSSEASTNGLTQAERQRLVGRHFETMEQRKLEEDYYFLEAIKAAQILSRAKG